MKNSSSLESYQQDANVLFKLLRPVFTGENNCGNMYLYWPTGNVFDTITDYFSVAIGKTINQTEVNIFMNGVANSYDNTTPPYYYNPNQAGIWYDDFGWWGIACAKVYSPAYKQFFPAETVKKYKSIAQSCWNFMYKGGAQPGQAGAPNVWKNCSDPNFASVAPRFAGGVWQNDITFDHSPLYNYGNYTNLGPYQDTVVNGLYLVLGLRVPSVNPGFPQPTIDELYKFIKTWCFSREIVNPEDGWLYYTDPAKGDAAVIKERVKTYFDKSRVNPVCWGDHNVAWCGDQGLMLGGMVDYLKIAPTEVLALTLIKLILRGVVECMTNDDHIIQPWYPSESVTYPCMDNSPSFPDADRPDYCCGPGVFMRYLLYAYRNNADVRRLIRINDNGIRTVIMASADAIIVNFKTAAPPPPDSQEAFFNYFNQLSILTTAIAILTDENDEA